MKKQLLCGLVIILVSAMLYKNVYTINNGEVGVITRNGVIQDHVVDPGIHFKAPFFDTIETVDISLSSTRVDLQVYTSDYISTNLSLQINYKISNPFEKFTLLDSTIANETNLLISNFASTELIDNQEEFTRLLEKKLSESVSGFLTIESVQIRELDFGSEWNLNKLQEQKDKILSAAKLESETIVEEAKQEIVSLNKEKEELEERKSKFEVEYEEAFRNLENVKSELEENKKLAENYASDLIERANSIVKEAERAAEKIREDNALKLETAKTNAEIAKIECEAMRDNPLLYELETATFVSKPGKSINLCAGD